MSAYLVDRHHIAFLVAAAMQPGCYMQSWMKSKTGTALLEKAAYIFCQELTKENLNSIHSRYPDCEGDAMELPGDTGLTEPWSFREFDSYFWKDFPAVDVLKSAACYRYQACEHEGWKDSLSAKFIDQLEQAYIGKVPGYDDALWGAPEPRIIAEH